MAYIIPNEPVDKKKLYRSFSTTSAAHTYGNVTSIIEHYIKSKFSEEYFKQVNVNTKISFKQYDFRRNSIIKKLHKISKPSLSIKPRVILTDDDRFLEGTLSTTRFTDEFRCGDMDELMPFFEDNQRNIFIKYLRNRQSMEFDVAIYLGSTMEQIDVATYLKNAVRWNLPLWLNCYLENNVSSHIMNLVSKDSGIPLVDDQGSNARFLDYCNSYSVYPITQKLKTSTGTTEYFRYYNTDLEIEFKDLDMSEVSMKGMTDDEALVTFSVKVEFWGTGIYYYFTENPRGDLFNDISSFADPGSDLIPLFTIDLSTPNNLPEGFVYYTSQMFSIEDTDDAMKEDITDIKPLFESSMLELIEYCNKHSINKNLYISFVIMQDDTELPADRYSIDLDKFELHLYNASPDVMYRLVIYANKLYVNRLVMEINDAEEGQNKSAIDCDFLFNRDIRENINRQHPATSPYKYPLNNNYFAQNLGGNVVNPTPPIVNPDARKVFIGTTRKEKLVREDILGFPSSDIATNEDVRVEVDLFNERIVVAVPVDWHRCFDAVDSYGEDILWQAEIYQMRTGDNANDMHTVYLFRKELLNDYRVLLRFE